MYFWGTCFLIVGALAKLYFKKSAFERRNEAGVEEHSSYWSMLVVRFLEASCSLSILIGVCLIIIGGSNQ